MHQKCPDGIDAFIEVRLYLTLARSPEDLSYSLQTARDPVPNTHIELINPTHKPTESRAHRSESGTLGGLLTAGWRFSLHGRHKDHGRGKRRYT